MTPLICAIKRRLTDRHVLCSEGAIRDAVCPPRHSVPSGSWSHFTYFLSFRHAAVGDLNADRIVVQVVVYPRHTTPRIQNYEKKGFVPRKRSSNISHFCKQLHFNHLKPSKETLLTFILMASISCTVLCESKCVGMLRCALLDDHLFAVDDVDAWGQGACFGGVVCHLHAVEVVDGLAEFV